MDLGGKIRQARLEAGLSQRQLCGEEITRNMLSLIENGAAKPSMKTLEYLARQLDKPLSWFLDENAGYQTDLLTSAENLRRAGEALAEGREIYAGQLLETVTSPLLLREKLLLAAKLPGANVKQICENLPSLDEELLLRAKAAWETEHWERCRRLLEAAEDRNAPRWNLLMGKLYMQEQSWEEAVLCLEQAETAFSDAVPLLETCFRELGDYKRAYDYACKQKR